MLNIVYNGEMDPRQGKAVTGKVIPDIMEKDPKVVYLDADLMSCIGTLKYAKTNPRAIECGIAEANMIGVAAGLAAAGFKPICHSFGIFASRRVFDQAFLSAGYAKNDITILGSDAGVSAALNGGTHMPFEDMALYSALPGATVIDVSDLNIDQVVTHTVAQGDTLANIIVKYNSKATKDQIRWSNGMKNETLTVGKSIYVPLLNGIVYKAKSGDTPESLAKKYGSDAELIIAYNNLENKTISANMMVLLPNGTLPEKERPEYVAPTPRPTTPSYSYTYS